MVANHKTDICFKNNFFINPTKERLRCQKCFTKKANTKNYNEKHTNDNSYQQVVAIRQQIKD